MKNFTILKVAACRLGGMHTGFDGMHVGFDGMHIGLALFMLLFRYAPILARFSTICIPWCCKNRNSFCKINGIRVFLWIERIPSPLNRRWRRQSMIGVYINSLWLWTCIVYAWFPVEAAPTALHWTAFSVFDFKNAGFCTFVLAALQPERPATEQTSTRHPIIQAIKHPSSPASRQSRSQASQQSSIHAARQPSAPTQKPTIAWPPVFCYGFQCFVMCSSYFLDARKSSRFFYHVSTSMFSGARFPIGFSITSLMFSSYSATFLGPSPISL